MSRRFKARCKNCGAPILMVKSTNGWKPMDRGNKEWIRHNCLQSEDFEMWLSEKMGWSTGGDF